jgi:hypothetical protein
MPSSPVSCATYSDCATGLVGRSCRPEIRAALAAEKEREGGRAQASLPSKEGPRPRRARAGALRLVISLRVPAGAATVDRLAHAIMRRSSRPRRGRSSGKQMPWLPADTSGAEQKT